MGAAARVLGMPYDLFRPVGCEGPMRPERRVLRLCAAFDGGDPGYRRPRGYERALRGVFDADCTQVGDYMSGARGVLFIAALPTLQRPLCVLTNAVFSVLRVGGAAGPGLSGYGGVVATRLHIVLETWPAAVLGVSVGRGGLPEDGGVPRWSVLLPITGVAILGSDLLENAGGERFVVEVAERSELGWRLLVRRAGV